jgi:hypothetical protein
MKTKTCISTCALIAVSATMTHADLTFTAPGMTTPHLNTQLSKNWTDSLDTYWKYIITGYEYRIYAGVPNGGKVSGTGSLRYKTGSSDFPGLTNVSVSVNGNSILSGSLSTSSISGTTGLVSHSFSSPIILENQSISPAFSYSTNMIGGGDYIKIHGSALTAPPIPIGTLIAPSYVRDGGKPTLQWFITKSLSNEVVVVMIAAQTDIESSNSGSGQSNNGHGNNVDGIDSSNPGKSAAKWALKGYYDTDYNGDGIAEDDEGHGGGSAISQDKNTNPEPIPAA